MLYIMNNMHKNYKHEQYWLRVYILKRSSTRLMLSPLKKHWNSENLGKNPNIKYLWPNPCTHKNWIIYKSAFIIGPSHIICMLSTMLDSLSWSNHTLFMQCQGTDCTVMSLTLSPSYSTCIYGLSSYNAGHLNSYLAWQSCKSTLYTCYTCINNINPWPSVHVLKIYN